MAVMEKAAATAGESTRTRKGSRLRRFLAFCKANPSFAIGTALMVFLLLVAIFAQYIVPNDPYSNNPKCSLLPPFWMNGSVPQYPLGTDYIGRCLLSRIIMGVRTSVVICVIAITVAIALGVSFGIVSGMNYPGVIDSVLMRITDIQLGFPFVVLVIIMISLVGQTILSVALVLALCIWAPYARNIRSSAIIDSEMDYVSAARSMGASGWRIATKYLGVNILPNILPVIPMDLATVIVTESLLSYMGLGIQPPMISLGNIMGDGKNYISTSWWITALPGFLIVIMVVSLTLIGDALHKYYDPKLRD